MADFSPEIWCLLLGVAALGTGSALHALAAAARNETNVHDLKIRVASLRIDYANRLAELQRLAAESNDDVLILPDRRQAPGDHSGREAA